MRTVRCLVLLLAVCAASRGPAFRRPVRPRRDPAASRPHRRVNAPASKGVVDRYLDALVAHDAFSLPLAPGVVFSENSQRLPMGDGLWNTATGLGEYRLYVSDPESGQVGFFGTVLENGGLVALALRLKLENQRIVRDRDARRARRRGRQGGGRHGAAAGVSRSRPGGVAAHAAGADRRRRPLLHRHRRRQGAVRARLQPRPERHADHQQPLVPASRA